MPQYRTQEPPFCVQVELVEGCNLRCSLCGLNGIRGKDNNFKFMSLHTVNRLVGQLKTSGWNSRIEFAMHGEPSLHPRLVSIVRSFRKRLPSQHLMMTSNGAGFLKEPAMIDSILSYLNVLALDDYDDVSIVAKLLARYDGDLVPQYYPDAKQANPHRRRKPSDHDWVVVRDIQQATSGTHATLNNHAGCGAPKNDAAEGKRCAKPFRELSIRWDGSVAICCNDWRGVYKCGNVNDVSLEDIWQSEEMNAARVMLYRGLREFEPCLGCDAISYRPGLLPDKMGKEEMPSPSKQVRDVLDRAIKGAPLTEPVLREWESGNHTKKSPLPSLGEQG